MFDWEYGEHFAAGPEKWRCCWHHFMEAMWPTFEEQLEDAPWISYEDNENIQVVVKALRPMFLAHEFGDFEPWRGCSDNFTPPGRD